jgi:23S rRNA (cytidine1920-2'-O)/16S rRNA (cytidine1409-2'-O)-methyltransferase
MPHKPKKSRLDVLLVERGLAESISKAQAMILASDIRVENEGSLKPGSLVWVDARIDLTGRTQKYVSRGGFKLEGALEDFAVNPASRICLDIGSSTGGFTDCLLQNGAVRVYAVDVNTSQLAWKLHEDFRVVRVKRNARELKSTDVPERVSLVVADVSFISVTKVLPPAIAAAQRDADFLILVKPQFELSRQDVPLGGIVRDPILHEKATAAARSAAIALGLQTLAVSPSRLAGAEGNHEFFLHLRVNS